MAILQGVWKFNSELTMPSDSTVSVKFISNGINFTVMNLSVMDNSVLAIEYELEDSSAELIGVYNSTNGWSDEVYRTVDFGETGIPFADDDHFYVWFTSNAEYVGDVFYSIKRSTLTAIANSIRGKTGKTDLVEPVNMPVEIDGIAGSDGRPIEVDSLDNSLLVEDNTGKVYECGENLYQVNKITSLKGLTIKFNEHITPCPVIGKDDEFECSGIAMGNYFTMMENKPSIIAIKKNVNSGWTHGTGIINFVLPFIDDLGGNPELHYFAADNQEESRWFVHDGAGGIYETDVPAVVCKFDCPALNENLEFIEWVLANGRIYPATETLNDINSFKVDIQTIEDVLYFLGAITSAGVEKNISNGSEAINIEGQYVAIFSVNEELITKTFSNILFDGNIENGFSFCNNDDVLFFGFNDDVTEPVIKYNDVILDGEITFSTFDCIFNDSYHFLSYALAYCELIDMEYINGCEFVEYLVPTGTKKITQAGEVVDVKEYEKVIVTVENGLTERELFKILRGEY